MNNDLISRAYLLDIAEKQNNLLDGGDVRNAPSVDAVPVVRCKHCKHAGEKHCQLVGGLTHIRPYDFCSYGERKDTA